jgi:phosphoesterase RecJ-like protein
MSAEKNKADQREAMREIARIMRSHDHFLITSHLNPDGDAIGSMLALAMALERLGKKTALVNADPTPDNLRDLPFQENIQIGTTFTGPCEVIFFIECTDPSRCGLENLPSGLKINLDHHLDNTFYGDINLVDTDRAALGELVFDLLLDGGFEPDRDMVTNLYMAIITDTGSFKHANTNSETFAICSKMLRYGIDNNAISNMAFNTFSGKKLMLMGTLLGRCEMMKGGQIACMTLRHDMIPELDITPSDTEGIIDYLHLLKDMRIAVFIKEFKEGVFRVSLRSRGPINVADAAKDFGGGGHKNAAGLTIRGTYDRLREQLFPRLEEALKAYVT